MDYKFAEGDEVVVVDVEAGRGDMGIEYLGKRGVIALVDRDASPDEDFVYLVRFCGWQKEYYWWCCEAALELVDDALMDVEDLL